MGRHNTPRGEASTAQGIQSKQKKDTGGTPGYKGTHRQEDKIAGSDVPPRGQGIREDKAK